MLWYIADGSTLMPANPFAGAKGLPWCLFEKSWLEPLNSPARFLTAIAPERGLGREHDISVWQSRARNELTILDGNMADHDFITGADCPIADISVFGYVHVAPEGGIDLDGFQAVRNWIVRVEATPDFVRIEEGTSLPLSAMTVGVQRPESRVA